MTKLKKLFGEEGDPHENTFTAWEALAEDFAEFSLRKIERGVVALERIAEILGRVTCEMQSGHTVIKIDGYVGLKR